MKQYRLGTGQFVVWACAVVAAVGGILWILKEAGVPGIGR